MRIAYSPRSKRKDYRYNLLYERGKHFTNLQINAAFYEYKALRTKNKREELSKKIRKLIGFFCQKFVEKINLLEVMEKEVFSLWEKQNFAKEIPQAMIQMENCMKKYGFEKEWDEWNSFVKKSFTR